jgi:dTDP-4-amino-4,6-dideoxygalactose transaminase
MQVQNVQDVSVISPALPHFIAAHSELAIKGGQAVIKEGAVTNWPAATPRHVAPLRVVVESGRYHRVNHPIVTALEQSVSTFACGREARAVGSGTAAIHITLDYFRSRGNQVVTAALNWPGAVGPIAIAGLEPVFADVELGTASLDPDLAIEAVNPATGAVLITHLFGGNSRCPRLRQKARANGTALLDDVCQSIGALQRIDDGRLLDSDALMLSGNGAKHLGAGELGFLVTDHSSLIDHVDRVSLTSSSRNGERVFSPDTLGFNYRPNVFSASLARSRLARMDEQLSARRRNATFLWPKLRECSGLVPLFDVTDGSHSFLNFPLRLDLDVLDMPHGPAARDVIVEALRAEGVPVWVWLTKPVFDYLPAFRGKWSAAEFPNTVTLLDTMFYVSEIAPPNGLGLMHAYADAFRKVWAAMPELRVDIRHRAAE